MSVLSKSSLEQHEVQLSSQRKRSSLEGQIAKSDSLELARKVFPKLSEEAIRLRIAAQNISSDGLLCPKKPLSSAICENGVMDSDSSNEISIRSPRFRRKVHESLEAGF